MVKVLYTYPVIDYCCVSKAVYLIDAPTELLPIEESRD